MMVNKHNFICYIISSYTTKIARTYHVQDLKTFVTPSGLTTSNLPVLSAHGVGDATGAGVGETGAEVGEAGDGVGEETGEVVVVQVLQVTGHFSLTFPQLVHLGHL